MNHISRKLLSLLLTLAVLVSMLAVPAVAADAEIVAQGDCGPALTWQLTDDGTLTISGSGSMYNYAYRSAPWYDHRSEIVALELSEAMSTVGSHAFMDLAHLIEVTLPTDLTHIHHYAFARCENLTKVTFPDRFLTTIEEFAFMDCSRLPKVELPDTVTTLGESVFEGCAKLTGIVLPDSITAIPTGAFLNCANLRSIGLPAALESIGDNAFVGCMELREFHMPDTVTTLGKSIFMNCCMLSAVTLSKGLTELPTNTFYGCDGLGTMVIPEGITTIGNGCFNSCDYLADVTLPSTLTSLGDNAFARCGALEALTLPQGLTSLGYQALRNTALTKLEIPGTVTSIGNYAFTGCSALAQVRFTGNAPTFDREPFLNVTTTCFYPAGDPTWADACQQYGGTLTWVPERTPASGTVTPTPTAVPTETPAPTEAPAVSASPAPVPTEIPEPSQTPAPSPAPSDPVEPNDPELPELPELPTPEPSTGPELPELPTPEPSASPELPTPEPSASPELPELPTPEPSATPELPELPEVHTHTYTTGKFPATCTEPGYTLHTCICGDSYKTDEVEPTGHMEGLPILENRVEPTATEPGHYDSVIYCAYCNAELSRTTIEIPVEDGVHGYVPIVEQTISISEQAYRWSLGFGTLYDINSDGTDELLLIFSNKSNPFAPATVYSLYTMVGNTPVPLAEQVQMYLDVGGPTGFIGVARTDGKHYFTVCKEGGETGDVEYTRSGSYTMYALKGLELKESQIAAYTATRKSGGQLVDSKSSSTINGVKGTYGDFERWKANIADEVSMKRFSNDDDPMVFELEDLLEHLKGLPPLPPHTHTPGDVVVESRVEPTCAKEGSYVEVSTCTVCGQEATRSTIAIPATGNHSWDKGVEVKAPTEEATGTRLYTCSVCGQTKTEDIPKLDHVHSHTAAVTEPTCTDPGFTTYTCTCGDTYTGSETQPLGHSWNEGAVTVEPTETTPGTLTRICTRCGETQTTQLPPKDHEHRYTETVTEPTCTELGFTTYTCTCGHSYKDRFTKATGHRWSEGIIIREPTDTTPGAIRYACTVCGHVKEEEIPLSVGIQRLSGKGRCDTALAAAEELKKQLGVNTFDAIIIASGNNFADALAGSYLAAVKNAPILLYQDSAAIKNLNFILENLSVRGTVYLLGGTAAVPQTMEDLLTINEVSVVRLAGKTRFDTNLEILKEAGVATGSELLVATAYNFADSLSASATGKPILLVDSRKDRLTMAQMDYLDSLGTDTKLTILGGNGAVSETMEVLLSGYGDTDRLAGKSRYETSVLIGEAYFENVNTVVLAYGRNFPDGLCGGPLAYSRNAPLLLTEAGSEAPAAAYVAENGVTTAYILGGTGALSEETVNRIFGQ